MTGEIRPTRKPCPSCPWRKSTPPGGFPGGRIDARRLLEMADGRMGQVMQCHCTPDDSRAAVCVGFALQVGPESLGYRCAVLTGTIDPDALETDEELHSLKSLISTHGAKFQNGDLRRSVPSGDPI